MEKNMQTTDYIVDICARHSEAMKSLDDGNFEKVQSFVDYVVNNYEITKRKANPKLDLLRKKEIKKEAKRRLNLWLKHSTFDEMTCYGSYIRFQMALGMAGYPFAPEPWMKHDYERFIWDYEFNSKDFDLIIEELFIEAQKNQNKI